MRLDLGGLLRLPRLAFFAAAVLYAAWIFTLSSGTLPALDLPFFAYLSNLAHAPLFGLLAVLLALGAWPRSPESAPRAALLIAWLLTGCYAVADEIHQSYTPGRTASAADVMTDVFGAALALVLLRRVLLRGRPQQLWHYAGLTAATLFAALVATLGG